MMCELCSSLARNDRVREPHERLRQVGLTQRIARHGRGKAAWVTFHVCDQCATQWCHVDDPRNPRAGWSVEQAALLGADPEGKKKPAAAEAGGQKAPLEN